MRRGGTGGGVRRGGVRVVGLGVLLGLACNADQFGQGSGSVGMPTPVDDTTTGETGSDETMAGTASMGGDGTATTAPTTGPGNSDTDGTPGDTDTPECTSDAQCPPGFICEGAQCVDTNPAMPCTGPMDCGPSAPFCPAVGSCQDGSNGAACNDNSQCLAPLLCGPSFLCHDGTEGDACLGPHQCSASAPHCGPDGQCHDGTDGDPCNGDDGQCVNLCGPSFTCQDGSEGDPCDGPSDCGPGAPHCPWDGQCHDGSFGDPCNGGDQCNGGCYGGFCGF